MALPVLPGAGFEEYGGNLWRFGREGNVPSAHASRLAALAPQHDANGEVGTSP